MSEPASMIASEPVAVTIRRARLDDLDELQELLAKVAASPTSNLARKPAEITDAFVMGIVGRGDDGGLTLLAVEGAAGDGSGGVLVGVIYAWPGHLEVFSHVLGELTIAVDPDLQGRGVGRALFAELLRIVRDELPAIERIELVTRESNSRGIAFYESLGFRREGRLERRIRGRDGTPEADIPMGWLRSR